jgi:hypothetical protein
MGLSTIFTPPKMPQSEEATKDQPLTGKPTEAAGEQTGTGETEDPAAAKEQQLLQKYGKILLDQIQLTRQSWEMKRRGIVLKVLKNKEMLKGNQFFGFTPGTFDTFDAMEQFYNFTGSGSDGVNGDRSMDRRPHNFYQMLENAFEAALSAQIPKNRWLPANADVLDDRETAKAASEVETIIERANKIRSMLKKELQELFTGGVYFKFTRYVVDADRTGTHKQTTLQVMSSEVMPARFVCFSCGASTQEDEVMATQKLACPQCGTPFSSQNYFESHLEQIPVASEEEDVPNGMVLQDVYSALFVDVDPDASNLTATSLLNLSYEVSLGWLRTTFPKFWKQFQAGQSDGTGSELMERQYRDMLTTPAGTTAWASSTSQPKPTYARNWCRPEFFAELEDENMAKELQKEFPDGLMIANVGELALQMRPAKLTKEWTACVAKEGFGMYPTPIGDPAVPVQERINDCISKIDEYMDRLACGILLANQQYLDTKAMNNKALLPGILNPVMFKKNAPISDIQNLIFQIKTEIDASIYTYITTLKQDMELLVGTPPQTFGAGTQQGVETMGGQKQQLDSGLMKLGLTWDLVREEHAEAAENAVMCAAKNMTEDWQNVVTDETKEFRANYVHMDQMKGSVHAEPETDQGFPMTYAEIKAFFENLINSKNDTLIEWLFSEPKNIDTAIRYTGVPGLVAPGAAMNTKVLRIIDQLVKSAPVQQPDPFTGEPIMIPSILPNKYLDDLAAAQKLVMTWSQEHWDKLEQNQNGLDNLVAYYKQCVVMEKELAAERQLAPMAPPAGGPQNAPPPGA